MRRCTFDNGENDHDILRAFLNKWNLKVYCSLLVDYFYFKWILENVFTNRSKEETRWLTVLFNSFNFFMAENYKSQWKRNQEENFSIRKNRKTKMRIKLIPVHWLMSKGWKRTWVERNGPHIRSHSRDFFGSRHKIDVSIPTLNGYCGKRTVI